MKQRERILQNILTHGACITVDRDSWKLEVVTTPRESCLNKWAIRNELRQMYPGDTRYINGVQVYKCQHNHAKTRYVVNGGGMVLFDDAIAAIESGKQPQETGALRQLELPISVEEKSA